MNIQAIFGSHILKMRNSVFIYSLIDIEDIPSFQRISIDGIADIDVHKTIIVYIHHGYPSLPSPQSSDARPLRYIFEFKISPVQKQSSGDHVTPEINIRQSIIIKIPDADTPAAIYIHDIHGVDGIVLGNFVIEIDSRMGGAYFLK